MNYTKKRWIYLIICCIANICLGSVYSWSVIGTRLADYFTIINGTVFTVGDLAVVYSIISPIGLLPMLIGGKISDKKGPRFVMVIGGAIYGLAFILSSFVTSLNCSIK